MTLLGNLVFFVFGGFAIFLGYVLGGIILCLTIIGIPFGFQCFKLAGGVLAAIFALTIVGLPIARQHIKLIPLALLPFGRQMRDIETGLLRTDRGQVFIHPGRPGGA